MIHALRHDIGSLIPDLESAIPQDPRTFKIRKWHGEVHDTWIDSSEPLYFSLQYPLLFPQAEGVFHKQLRLTPSSPPMQRLKWIRHLLLTDARFHQLGRLASEFICDAWATIEDERLRQTKWALTQAAPKSHLHHLHADMIEGEEVHETASVKVPATFVGSKAYMAAMKEDVQALCAAYDKPTWFITFTVNTGHPDITSELHPGQSAYDRPDLVCRVFKHQLDMMISDIKKGLVFPGKHVWHVHVIEYQHKGLPHAHILVRMSQEPSAEEIDQVKTFSTSDGCVL